MPRFSSKQTNIPFQNCAPCMGSPEAAITNRKNSHSGERRPRYAHWANRGHLTGCFVSSAKPDNRDGSLRGGSGQRGVEKKIQCDCSGSIDNEAGRHARRQRTEGTGGCGCQRRLGGSVDPWGYTDIAGDGHGGAEDIHDLIDAPGRQLEGGRSGRGDTRPVIEYRGKSNGGIIVMNVKCPNDREYIDGCDFVFWGNFDSACCYHGFESVSD